MAQFLASVAASVVAGLLVTIIVRWYDSRRRR